MRWLYLSLRGASRKLVFNGLHMLCGFGAILQILRRLLDGRKAYIPWLP